MSGFVSELLGGRMQRRTEASPKFLRKVSGS